MERSCFRSIGNWQGSEFIWKCYYNSDSPGSQNKHAKKVFSSNWHGGSGEGRSESPLTCPWTCIPYKEPWLLWQVFGPWRDIWKPHCVWAGPMSGTPVRWPIALGRNLTRVQHVYLEKEWSWDIRHRLTYVFLQSNIKPPFWKWDILLSVLVLKIFIAWIEWRILKQPPPPRFEGSYALLVIC